MAKTNQRPDALLGVWKIRGPDGIDALGATARAAADGRSFMVSEGGTGCILIQHGAKHDWYRNPNTTASQPIPRRGDINDHLARRIIRMLGSDSNGPG